MSAPDVAVPWFVDLLECESPSIMSLVPGGYERYLRVFHQPAWHATWSDVAQAAGTVFHPLAQWDSISGDLGPLEGPRTGDMGGDQWLSVLENLPQPRLLAAYWTGKLYGPNPIEGDHADFTICGEPYRAFAVDRNALMEMTQTSFVISPSYVWDAPRSFVIATGIDFDSTVVGCDVMTAERLQSDSTLECRLIEPHDSLMSESDRINARPKGRHDR
jgi:hypothetical protein